MNINILEMKIASLNDTVFEILKSDTRVNPAALQRMVDLANGNPVLNAYIVQSQTTGGVRFRLAEGDELKKEAAFFN